MLMRAYAGSHFIKVDDVRNGPRQETIAACSIGQFERPELTFESGDKLSLNKGNVRVMIDAYGDSDDGCNWIGKNIDLFLGEAPYQGKMVESVSVRPSDTFGGVSDDKPPTSENPGDGMDIPF